MPLYTTELLNISCIVWRKKKTTQFYIEKANTETIFSTTDVFTYSMQGLFLCIRAAHCY